MAGEESAFSSVSKDDPQTTHLCRVCGDRATGNHFGVLSCEACKSFFRRSARMSNQFACRGARNCLVTAKTRNRCPFCRLQKCFAVGMKIPVAYEEKPPMQVPPDQQYPTQPTVFVPSYPTMNVPQTFPFPMQHPTQPPVHYFPVPPPSQQGILPQPVFPAGPPSPQQSTGSSHSDSGLSSVLSDHESQKGSVTSNPTSPPELATTTTVQEDDALPNSTSPEEDLSQEDIVRKVTEQVPGQPQTQAADFLPGPDIPLHELNLDQLIASHQESQAPPESMKDVGESGVSLSNLMVGAKHTLANFVKWIKTIDAFCQLPKEDRLRCVKGCWIEQMILSIVYRSLILQSGKLVMSSGATFNAEDMRHELVAYTMARIMGEVMGSFKNLELDHKEFVCLRLLFLFSPDGSGLEGDVKAHVQRIQDQILIMLEDYCTVKAPNTPQRYSKLLIAMASLRSISQEAVQELEVKKAMQTAQFDVKQAFSHLDI